VVKFLTIWYFLDLCNCSFLTLLRLAKIGNSRAKTTGLPVVLHGIFSGLVSATDLVKRLKRCDKSFSLHSKKFFAWGMQIFCE